MIYYNGLRQYYKIHSHYRMPIQIEYVYSHQIVRENKICQHWWLTQRVSMQRVRKTWFKWIAANFKQCFFSAHRKPIVDLVVAKNLKSLPQARTLLKGIQAKSKAEANTHTHMWCTGQGGWLVPSFQQYSSKSLSRWSLRWDFILWRSLLKHRLQALARGT